MSKRTFRGRCARRSLVKLVFGHGEQRSMASVVQWQLRKLARPVEIDCCSTQRRFCDEGNLAKVTWIHLFLFTVSA